MDEDDVFETEAVLLDTFEKHRGLLKSGVKHGTIPDSTAELFYSFLEEYENIINGKS